MGHTYNGQEYNIGIDIWNRKYRYDGRDGGQEDKCVSDTWDRVATAVASVEKVKAKRGHWRDKFLDILQDYRFLPAGRILANAGTPRTNVTYSNCFVMNTIEDSIEGIFQTVKEAALTQKQGGGVGFDFSTIRPAGSRIDGAGADASGPISFMQVFDTMCQTIMSAGKRRGAQLAALRCDHPDIEAFIDAKRGTGKLTMFNLSVAVTDKFMDAVSRDLDWELVFNGEVYKTVKARYLWDKIMRSTYDHAEPGVLFIDTINNKNNLRYCENILTCNPCGEQPLSPYGACLLGSFNLTRYVKWYANVYLFEFDKFKQDVAVAVRMLDNVIELGGYPLEAQAMEARAKRRMGIGITGLASAMAMLEIPYGSDASLSFTKDIMSALANEAYQASAMLAKERGAFPKYDAKQYMCSRFVMQALTKETQALMEKHGMRNSHLLSIAPTGTISLFAGNVSSGIEPIFAHSYTRKIREDKGAHTEVVVRDYAVADFMERNPGKELPSSIFVKASDLTPDQHLRIMAVAQKYVDGAISKTINCPTGISFEDFKDIYKQAFQAQLKGCTTFRPNEHIQGILVDNAVDTKKDKTEAKTNEVKALPVDTKPVRPETLEGRTYKIKTPLSEEALYVTINDVIEDGVRRPWEVFINSKNLQHYSWIVATTRLISAVLRREKDPVFLVDELRSIYDPNGGYFRDGHYVPSLAADIGRALEGHLEWLGLIKPKHEAKEPAVDKPAAPGQICPKCGDRSLVRQEGCLKCLSCDYSKCG